jgi:hypothetical protein
VLEALHSPSPFVNTSRVASSETIVRVRHLRRRSPDRMSAQRKLTGRQLGTERVIAPEVRGTDAQAGRVGASRARVETWRMLPYGPSASSDLAVHADPGEIWRVQKSRAASAERTSEP